MRTLFVLFTFLVAASGVPLQDFAVPYVEQIFSEPARFPLDPEEFFRNLDQVNTTQFVYGGQKARPGQFPQHAFMLTKKAKGFFICGASLLSPTHALTAAHCVEGIMAPSQIMAGGLNRRDRRAPNAQWRSIHRATKPASYNSHTLLDDIAVVEFNPPMTLNRDVQLTKIVEDDAELLQEKKSYVTGFGTYTYKGDQSVSSDELLWAEIDLFDFSRCQQLWDHGLWQKQICAGAKNLGAGPGDSGGPLQVLHEGTLFQVGLTSYGTTDKFDDEFNQDRFPTVFTRVSSYCDFIAKVTDDAFTCSSLAQKPTVKPDCRF
uniref:Chymotrypsin-like serine protease n=1 Tax=Steinernema carpocapsae TaxID=34508 RepID=B8X3G3_STECR|nr:chymotrypsin-like serine protease precursor [Steinernema carpocapsae]ADZ30825.1 chymotrypsin-like serine protease precursor [Steinernema carpocapsae]